MRYYNEATTELNIRRKARAFTFTIMFLLVSTGYFMSTNTASKIWEEDLKEWFQNDTKEEPAKIPATEKKKRA